jgi:dephospho-CoA kinase
MIEGPPTSPPKPTIGLTGGIASGKSTVARMLEHAGAGIVDADQVAREVVLPGSEGLAEVVAAFGSSVLTADGSLDRGALASTVFGDEAARLRLQAILHPRIGRRSAERIEALHAGPVLYVIYEAPLLVEVGGYKSLAALIVVASSQESQLARAMRRDSVEPSAVKARIAAQSPLERKLEVADYVIWNDGSLSELERRTAEVHREILLRFGLGRTGRP